MNKFIRVVVKMAFGIIDHFCGHGLLLIDFSKQATSDGEGNEGPFKKWSVIVEGSLVGCITEVILTP